MKLWTLLGAWWCCLILLIGGGAKVIGSEVPDYRGKVILVVDKSMLLGPVVTGIDRLTADLVGDGWRVLRHDVERGAPTGTVAWAQQVKSTRALIKADYNSAPSEVRSVFLIGHVAVPYTGNSAAVAGHHTNFKGAHAADLFYGEMTSEYGYLWSDSIDHDTGATGPEPGPNGELSKFPNLAGDGRFDRNGLPSPLELAVGRVDFSGMDAFPDDESTLLARYFEKDHDFRTLRTPIFQSIYPPKAINVGWLGIAGFCQDLSLFGSVVGANQVYACDNNTHWFDNVQEQSFLLGWGGGYGWDDCEGVCVAGIGATSAAGPSTSAGIQSPDNNFVDFDSRVVFNFFKASYIGAWNITNSFCRAPLANPYNPSAEKFGLGLVSIVGGTKSTTFNSIALGSTIGESLFDYFFSVDLSTVHEVHNALMGDPTLRLHAIQPPVIQSALAVAGVPGGPANVRLTWSHTDSASLTGFRIYRGPTKQGPFVHVQDLPNNAVVLEVARPTSGPPDSFYMVRAKKAESTPAGSYDNMSIGAIQRVTGAIPRFLQIASHPSSVAVLPGKPASFSVDAIGINVLANEKITYQWFKHRPNEATVPVSPTDPRIIGAATRAILIADVQPSDHASSFHVAVSVIGQTISSQVASLSVATAPQAQDDPPVDVDVTSVTFLDVLGNDWDAQHPRLTLEAYPDVEPQSNSTADHAYPGIELLALNGGKQGISVTFIPHLSMTRLYALSEIPIRYTLSDGVGSSFAVAPVRPLPALIGGFGMYNLNFIKTGYALPSPNPAVMFDTSDFITWNSTIVTLDSTGTTTPLQSDFVAGSRFYTLKSDGRCSGNAVGYVKKSLPPGWSRVTVPVSVTTGTIGFKNSLDNIFNQNSVIKDQLVQKEMPNDCRLQKSDGTIYTYGPHAGGVEKWTDESGNPAGELHPGEGAFFFNPSSVPLIWKLIGSVPKAGRQTTLAPGFSLFASAIPRNVSFNELIPPGFLANTEDLIEQNDPASGISISVFDGERWLDNTTGEPVSGPGVPAANVRTLGIGEVAWYYNAGSTKTWIQSVSLCP